MNRGFPPSSPPPRCRPSWDLRCRQQTGKESNGMGGEAEEKADNEFDEDRDNERIGIRIETISSPNSLSAFSSASPPIPLLSFPVC